MTIKIQQQLKELDVVKFHNTIPSKDADNGAFEMITCGGQHIKVHNLPVYENGKLSLNQQASHRETYSELINRLFGLGIQVDKNVPFWQQVRSTVNSGGRTVLGDGYLSPEICILHYNEEKDGTKNQDIMVFAPAIVTSLQFDALTKAAEEYATDIIPRIKDVSIHFAISGYNPITCELDESLKAYPESFEELTGYLKDKERIQDYYFPFQEQIVDYDISLTPSGVVRS